MNDELARLKLILSRHEKFKKCYFWKPPGSAYARRQMETQNTDSICLDFMRDEYEIDQTVTCSCANVYYSLSVRVNGKQKDVRALKRLIGDMEFYSNASFNPLNKKG